jgi:hypothetical protein
VSVRGSFYQLVFPFGKSASALSPAFTPQYTVDGRCRARSAVNGTTFQADLLFETSGSFSLPGTVAVEHALRPPDGVARSCAAGSGAHHAGFHPLYDADPLLPRNPRISQSGGTDGPKMPSPKLSHPEARCSCEIDRMITVGRHLWSESANTSLLLGSNPAQLPRSPFSAYVRVADLYGQSLPVMRWGGVCEFGPGFW